LSLQRILALAAGLTFAVACNTPSIPIPPPELQDMSFDYDEASGTATYSYARDEDYGGAVVYVGTVGPTSPFAAALGDHIVVTYETEEQLVTTCAVLAAGTPSDECDL
jgi:hypothetical protein